MSLLALRSLLALLFLPALLFLLSLQFLLALLSLQFLVALLFLPALLFLLVAGVVLHSVATAPTLRLLLPTAAGLHRPAAVRYFQHHYQCHQHLGEQSAEVFCASLGLCSEAGTAEAA